MKVTWDSFKKFKIAIAAIILIMSVFGGEGAFAATTCPTGQKASSGTCICANNQLDISVVPSCKCPTDQKASNGTCICANNQLDISKVPSCKCSPGQTASNGTCQ